MTKGRKPTSTENTLYDFIRHLHDYKISGMPSWVDDIVMGACYTSAGVNKGKLNISPSYVKAAIFLPRISTESCQNIYSFDPISKRTAQRIAKAARFALNGIQLYLDKMTKEEQERMKQSWKIEYEFRKSYQEGRTSKYHCNIRPPLPENIRLLYEQGDYSNYARQSREFYNSF